MAEENGGATESAITPSSEIAAQAQKPAFEVPEEYKDAGWAKDIKSSDDLWKMNANAQSLIGKRPAGVPDKDASEEEWEKFYNAAGRPEEPSKYEFSEIDLPEGVDLAPHTEKYAELAHKYGLNQKQADGLRKEWLAHEMATGEANKEALDKQYAEITKKHFGDDFDAKQEAAVKYLDGKLPEDLDGHLRQVLTNDPLTQAAFVKITEDMTKQINDLKKRYGAEDSLKSGDQASGRSLDDIRSELAKLNISDANRNFDHPDNKETRKKIEILRGELQRAMR